MESLKVSDYMNNRPVIFKAEMPVAEAVEKLVHSRQQGGPVINENRQVVGFLSEQDCLKTILEVAYQNESHATVGDIMFKDVLAVKSYQSILELAEKMAANRPKVYPVEDENGKLVGVISRTDILRALDIHVHSIYESGDRFL